MTNDSPVSIVASDWPIIAESSGDSYSGSDYCRHQQALGQGECDTYWIRVRQHQDGRAIIYASCDGATAWTESESWRAGQMVDSGDDIIGAITEVATGCEPPLPESVTREIFEDLPARNLD